MIECVVSRWRECCLLAFYAGEKIESSGGSGMELALQEMKGKLSDRISPSGIELLRLTPSLQPTF